MKSEDGIVQIQCASYGYTKGIVITSLALSQTVVAIILQFSWASNFSSPATIKFMMLYPISLTRSKRHKQIPISVTSQNSGCKATREKKKINLVFYSTFIINCFNYNLSILEEVETTLIMHGLILQCCTSIYLACNFVDSFWGQVQLKDVVITDAELLCN